MEKVNNWKMFTCVHWLLAMLLKTHTTGSDFVTGGQIFPHVRFLHKGSNITFFCKLNKSNLTSYIFWRLNPDLTPALQYDRVNETVSSVTIHNLLVASVKVKCGIYTPEPQDLDEIEVETGYPPETPQNISCVYYHKQNFTCTWISGRDTRNPSSFTVTTETRHGKQMLCRTRNNSCSSFYSSEQYGCEYKVQVEAENAFGKAASHPILMNTAKLVKMDPPEVLYLKTLPVPVPSLELSWRRPTLAPDGLDVKCSLQYKELPAGERNFYHNLNMEKEEQMSYNLTGLNGYTEYVVSLRCIGNNGQILWSEWSEEIKGRTAEQAPSHSVELWRVISSSNNIRSVYLKWKERLNIRSLGIILGYMVQWFPEDKTFAAKTKTTDQNDLSLNISDKAYIISVAYYNSAGWSPNATLRIPANNEKAKNLLDNVQISTGSENTTVTWNVTDWRIQRFVVEWCVDMETSPCILFFQFVENTSEWTGEKGVFKPYKRYRLSINPILEERVEAPHTTYFYYKEGAPLRGPNAKIENIGKTEATIKWDPITQDEANGFLTTFSIVYKSLNEHESVVTVDSHVYKYTLQLLPNRLYIAYIVASTLAGNTSGEPVQFKTLKYNNKEIGSVTGTVGICVILLVVAGITYVHKKEKIRQLFWPNIPDPTQSSIAEWPSKWSQTAPIQNLVRSDGEFHSGDFHVLHAGYKNEKVPLIDEENRKLLFADISKSTGPCMIQEHSSLVHYATTESCHERLACTPRFYSTSCSASSSSSSLTSLCDLDGGIQEVPHTLELAKINGEDIAVVNPYLKNSVSTREAIHVADNGSN
ncbi:interleukin-31 receptor subunit alpha isoform X2 [Mixophyes fleayi]|uniref:interleukin-31 receptor subunit alpha isoform X2 n=1 Tax=Mixophyes fleayi TaxID=3061075 RepID=UPI003F4E25B2